jgi:hypothetical protein
MAAESAPPAHLVHLIDGRARLRIPSRRGDEAFFHRLVEKLRKAENVTAVAANLATASILVHFTGAWAPIARAATRQGLFGVDADAAPVSALSRISAPSMLAAFGMAALGLLQVARNQSLPAAITLFWYAAQLAKGKLDSER